MATYIRLLRFSDQAAKDLKQLPERIVSVKKTFRDAGVEVKQLFLVMGQYDFVAVLEAPHDEAVAKVALGQAILGVFRSSETLRAFTEEEFGKIIAALP